MNSFGGQDSGGWGLGGAGERKESGVAGSSFREWRGGTGETEEPKNKRRKEATQACGPENLLWLF